LLKWLLTNLSVLEKPFQCFLNFLFDFYSHSSNNGLTIFCWKKIGFVLNILNWLVLGSIFFGKKPFYLFRDNGHIRIEIQIFEGSEILAFAIG